jgi:hypothetical protein
LELFIDESLQGGPKSVVFLDQVGEFADGDNGSFGGELLTEVILATRESLRGRRVPPSDKK